MTDLIEKVARDVYREFENRPDYAQLQMNGVIAEELARVAATTILREMMEPTDAMMDAGGSVPLVECWPGPDNVWEAMLKAFAQHHHIDLGGEDESD